MTIITTAKTANEMRHEILEYLENMSKHKHSLVRVAPTRVRAQELAAVAQNIDDIIAEIKSICLSSN